MNSLNALNPVNTEKLSALGYLAGWRLVRLLPHPVARTLFRFGADLFSRNGRGMDQLRANLSRVVGPEHVTRELVRDATRSYARYWMEAFRLPSISKDPALMDRLRDSVVGLEIFDRSRDLGRGIIITAPHSGNWDMSGAFLVSYNGQFTTVAERVRPEELFNAFVEFRESLGFEVLPLTGGDTPPFERLREVLRAGGVVCLLGERDLRGSGVETTFFGEQTSMPAGPAQLAIETGAPLHVVHPWFEADGWGLSVSDPVEVDNLSDTVQRIADLFAANIAAHPRDWHMLQPLWFADLDADRHPRGQKGA